MQELPQLAATSRQGTRSQIRKRESIPAVLYGHSVSNKAIEVDSKLFTKVFAQSGLTTLINLTIGGKSHTVLVREIQFHPVRDTVIHVDFYQVRLDEKVRTQVPLAFSGESAAVKDQSGVLVKSIDELDLEALPQDFPHDIPVDISVLTNFESVIHVRDLAVPKGVTVFNDPEEVVALVQPPRSEQELESLSEEATEDVESVETVTKEKAADEAEDGEETPAAPAPEEKS